MEGFAGEPALGPAKPDPGDAGKKIKGRKRHIVTDTLGLMLFAVTHGADVQGRDGAPEVLEAIRYRFPWLRRVFAKPAPDLIRGRLCRAKAARGAQGAR